MTRFLVTIEGAARFLVRAAERMRGGEVFVPKLPSARMMDMVAALAPGCRVDYIGARPGERLHEQMISEDEAKNVLDVDDMYVIAPVFRDTTGYMVPGARRVPEGFHYASHDNPQWLSVAELQAIVAQFEKRHR
jgi:UDP-N-acetylglucosamine 4,6-dehydratase